MLKKLPVLSVCLIAALAVWPQRGGDGFSSVQAAAAPVAAEAEHPALGGTGEAKEGHPTTGAASDDHGATHGEAKSPLDWKNDLALWSLVVFVLFLVVLKKMAWAQLIAGLDKRERKIREDIESAEAARVKSERMLAEHAARMDKVQDEIREILAEARRDAEHTRQDILSSASKEAELTKQRAIQEIERVRDQALEELFMHMGQTVANATERVLGRTLTDGDHTRLIDEALTEFARR